jgi:putative ABC transport system permease protein
MNEDRLPAWIVWLLSWICPEHLYEEIEGDLMQQFNKDSKSKGIRTAKQRLIWNAIRFCRPGIVLRRKFAINFHRTHMLRSYFRVGARQLARTASFSLINIAGLSIGIAAAFFIFLYLNFEVGYDSFHENKDEVYRIVTVQHEDDLPTKTSAETFYGVASFMKESFPEVKEAVRCYKWPASTGILLNVNNRIFNERNYLFAEAGFFRIFPSMLSEGDPSAVLSKPNAAVISRRLALKLFGKTEVIGESLGDMEQMGTDIIITGLLNDAPSNLHFDVDVVRSYSKDWIPEGNQWEWLNSYTYVALEQDASLRKIEKDINEATQKNQTADSPFKKAELSLQPISDIHFDDAEGNFKASIDPMVLYVVGGALVIVLLMAWINYINLETARFVRRIREAGVRKIIGSSTSDLILQFFIQYIILYFIALSLAVLMIYFLLPFFEQITGIEVSAAVVFVPWLWKSVFILFVIGSIITGIVPAIVLIRFNPVASIKGQIANGMRGSTVRRSLLVFQFVSSSVLIAFLLVVTDQLEFMRKEKTNIDLSQVVTVYNPTNYSSYENSSRGERNEALRNQMLANAAIINMTSSSAIPGEPVGFTYVDLAKRSLNDANKQIPYKVIYVDYDFLNVYGLKLKAGRNYSPEFGKDLNWESLVITERAVHDLGFVSNEEALNQEIHFMAGSDWKKYTIVGIVEDYRHESVKVPVYPTIFFLHQNRGQMVYYSLTIDKSADRKEAVDHIEATWKKVWPEKPFQYFFMDSHYDQQYKSEIFFANIFAWFSGIAAFIACLGIFGITLSESNSRLKEVSIRRVLGATAANLFNVLTKDHVRLSILSLIIAFPMIYYWANAWLERYPLRIEIAPLFFIAPPLTLLLIIAVISFWQTYKMTRSNPVDHIRHE